MAVSQKLSEIGWFYHAPAPPKNTGPVNVPLASQIPGLNDLSGVPYEEEPRPIFRDTDTKYVRLAKMGGREDLLRFRDPKPRSKEPVPYPRNEWYYLEDNRMEEQNAEPTRPWEFRLPEYMVHDEHMPFGDEYDYTNDPEGLVYWKKGRVPPGTKEIKRVTRGEQLPVSAPPTMPPRTKGSSAAHQHGDSRYPPVPQMYDREGRPAMNKLLAYGYASEWQSARDDWYNELRMMEGQAEQAASAKVSQHPNNKNSRTTMTWNEVMKKRTQPVNAARRVPSHTRDQATDKAAFKLSRFEKVGPKINSHRPLPPIHQGL